jgi:hypothetical protein
MTTPDNAKDNVFSFNVGFATGEKKGRKDALEEAHKALQALAMRAGWDTDSDAYACDQVIQGLMQQEDSED